MIALMAIHLCVVQHGLWGNPSNLAALASQLEQGQQKESSEFRLVVLNSAVNVKNKTHDGIDVAGTRLAQLVVQETGRLNGAGGGGGGEEQQHLDDAQDTAAVKVLINRDVATVPSPAQHDDHGLSGRHVARISFVGYSLGGLICRYAVGHLAAVGYFDSVQPVNFITIASPHLGSWM